MQTKGHLSVTRARSGWGRSTHDTAPRTSHYPSASISQDALSGPHTRYRCASGFVLTAYGEVAGGTWSDSWRSLNAVVCSRLHGPQETLSAATITLEISSRNARVQALQKRWDRLRAVLDLILNQRGADMADLPGGASGILRRDYKGKEADRLVARIAPGVVSLVADLRGRERQAAEELGQWKTARSPAPDIGRSAVPTFHEAVFLGKGSGTARIPLRGFVKQERDVLEPGTKFSRGSACRRPAIRNRSRPRLHVPPLTA
jgi:hypothetical protein